MARVYIYCIVVLAVVTFSLAKDERTSARLQMGGPSTRQKANARKVLLKNAMAQQFGGDSFDDLAEMVDAWSDPSDWGPTESGFENVGSVFSSFRRRQ